MNKQYELLTHRAAQYVKDLIQGKTNEQTAFAGLKETQEQMKSVDEILYTQRIIEPMKGSE